MRAFERPHIRLPLLFNFGLELSAFLSTDTLGYAVGFCHGPAKGGFLFVGAPRGWFGRRYPFERTTLKQRFEDWGDEGRRSTQGLPRGWRHSRRWRGFDLAIVIQFLLNDYANIDTVAARGLGFKLGLLASHGVDAGSARLSRFRLTIPYILAFTKRGIRPTLAVILSQPRIMSIAIFSVGAVIRNNRVRIKSLSTDRKEDADEHPSGDRPNGSIGDRFSRC